MMTKSFLENNELALAKKFLDKIKNVIVPATNPAIIRSILQELNLHKFISDDIDFINFLNKIKNEPINMTPFLEQIKYSILNNASLCSFLAYIEENQLIADEEINSAAELLQLNINILCVFEAFVITMANSSKLAEDIYRHILKRRNSYFNGNPISNFFFSMPKETNIFERLKIVSVEPPMLSIIFHKSTRELIETEECINQFVKKYQLSGLNSNIISVAALDDESPCSISGMGINILEANWEEVRNDALFRMSSSDNAMAGFALISLMEHREYLTKIKLTRKILPEGEPEREDGAYKLLPGLKIDNCEKKISQFGIDKEWRDLYTSWNLRFVITNLNTVFLPLKLLLPSVLSAEPVNYKEMRTISLFLFANLFLNEKVKNNKFFMPDFKLKNAEVLLSAWAKINKKYSAYLLKKLCPEVTKTPESLYRDIFGNYPTYSLLKNLIKFAYETDKFRITSLIPTKKTHEFLENQVLINSPTM